MQRVLEKVRVVNPPAIEGAGFTVWNGEFRTEALGLGVGGPDVASESVILRVDHVGRFTCHVISGRGDQSMRIPDG